MHWTVALPFRSIPSSSIPYASLPVASTEGDVVQIQLYQSQVSVGEVSWPEGVVAGSVANTQGVQISILTGQVDSGIRDSFGPPSILESAAPGRPTLLGGHA